LKKGHYEVFVCLAAQANFGLAATGNCSVTSVFLDRLKCGESFVVVQMAIRAVDRSAPEFHRTQRGKRKEFSVKKSIK
jgi:hypothetical protein